MKLLTLHGEKSTLHGRNGDRASGYLVTGSVDFEGKVRYFSVLLDDLTEIAGTSFWSGLRQTIRVCATEEKKNGFSSTDQDGGDAHVPQALPAQAESGG